MLRWPTNGTVARSRSKGNNLYASCDDFGAGWADEAVRPRAPSAVGTIRALARFLVLPVVRYELSDGLSIQSGTSMWAPAGQVVRDCRRGSVSENWRKCEELDCVCGRVIVVMGRGFCGLGVPWGVALLAGSWLGEVEKVRREVGRSAEFAAICEQIAAVNEKICAARPAAGTVRPRCRKVKKGAMRGDRAGEGC